MLHLPDAMPSLLAPLIADYEQQLNNLLPLERLELNLPIALQPLPLKKALGKEVQVSVLRSDGIHPTISGNKWFKLKYNLLAARVQGCEGVVSCGGAWSNHLHALAQGCGRLNIPAHGIVRGNELHASSNVMLQDAADQGMSLEFVDRAHYRSLRSVKTVKRNHYFIPEGGDNWLGVLGAATMASPLSKSAKGSLAVSHVVTAMGTGCTFAGLRLGLPDRIRLLGVSALKGQWPIQNMQQRFAPWFPYGQRNNWHIYTDYHRGGFGKTDSALKAFCSRFETEFGFALDYLYTGKAMMALVELIQKGVFEPGSHIVFVHSGGLQGNR